MKVVRGGIICHWYLRGIFASTPTRPSGIISRLNLHFIALVLKLMAGGKVLLEIKILLNHLKLLTRLVILFCDIIATTSRLVCWLQASATKQRSSKETAKNLIKFARLTWEHENYENSTKCQEFQVISTNNAIFFFFNYFSRNFHSDNFNDDGCGWSWIKK